ncbi:MAG: phage baseplate assembly protein V [Alkalilacustris sp.]
MADSPALAATGPLEVVIEIDGRALSGAVEVLGVETSDGAGRIARGRVRLRDGSPVSLSFPLTDAAGIRPGADIAVKARYGSGALQTVFDGLILALRTRILASDGECILELDCRGRPIRLHQIRASALYTDKTDSDIITEIAKAAGLQAQVTATGASQAQTLRSDCTDWEYLRLLADRNGLLLHAEGSTLHARPPDVAAEPVLSVTFGTDLYDVDLEISAQRAYSQARLQSWDIDNQKLRQVDSKPPKSPRWGKLTLSALAEAFLRTRPRGPTLATPADLDQDLLQACSDAIVQGTELGRIVGAIRFAGSGRVRPNTTLDLRGLAERLNGTAFVTGVEHVLDAQGWVTTAQLGALPDDEGFGTRRPVTVAAGVTTPVHGLQVGLVRQIHGDPDNRARVQIVLPMISGTEEGVWARLGTPYGGNATGFDFLPEIGDEVLVGFMGGDPSHPVILGAVHSPKNTGPVAAEENNPRKILQTRSGTRLTFDDDRKAVTVDTPGGAQLTLDDDAGEVTVKDQNGNVATFGSGGITLKSPRDITLEATGNVVLKASEDVTAQGTNVTAEAQASATVKGNASAEISAAGTTTVKGSMVMIN